MKPPLGKISEIAKLVPPENPKTQVQTSEPSETPLQFPHP